jgi:hypothetical protein
MTDSEFDGHWIFEVYDPRGGSSRATRFTLDMGVHLRSH